MQVEHDDSCEYVQTQGELWNCDSAINTHSFRRYNQASASNPFLAKRILTKTHSGQISPVRANYSNIYGNHTEARVFDQFFFRLLHLSRKALFKRAGRRYCIVFKFSRQYIIIHKNITQKWRWSWNTEKPDDYLVKVILKLWEILTAFTTI